MDFQTINLILLGFVCFFVFFGLFWGMVRGLKKTAFRLAWLIVTATVLIFVTPIITRALMDLKLFTTTYNNIEVKSVNQFFTAIIASEENLSALAQSNPQIYEYFQKLPAILVNMFAFVLLFWLAKIILYPIWAIFSAKLIKKKDKDGNKIKKHRFLGLLVGGFVGIFISSVTVMPVINIIGLVNKVESETSDTTSNKGIVSTLLKDTPEYFEYLQNFNKTYMNQIYTYSGMNAFGGFAFNSLTTQTINDVRINLEEEAISISKTYKLALKFENFDIENFATSKEDINTVIEDVKDLINSVFDIKIFHAVGNFVIPYAIETQIINNPDFLSSLPTIEGIDLESKLVDVFETFKEYTVSTIKNDIISMLNVAKSLNENDVFIPLYNLAKNGGDLSSASSLLTTTIIDGVVDNLVNINVISAILPVVFDTAINYGINQLDITGFQLADNSVTKSELTSLIKNIFKTGLAVYNTIDQTSEYYVTKDSIIGIGKLVDIIKTYPKITNTNFKLLLEYGVGQILSFVNPVLESAGLPAFVVNNIEDSIKEISNITNFENEFTVYSNVFDSVLEIMEDAELQEPEYNLPLVGSVLDKLKNSIVFDSLIIDVLKDGIDYAISLPELSTISTQTKANINSIKQKITNDVSWEEELVSYEDIISLITALMEDPNSLDNLMDKNHLYNIGLVLNKLETDSQIFNGSVVTIIEVLLDVAPIGSGQPAYVNDFISGLKTNVSQPSGQSLVWSDELFTLGEFLEVFMQGNASYLAIGTAIDTLLENSSLVTKSNFNSVIASFVNDALPNEYASFKTAMINAIPSIKSYETEMKAIENMLGNIQDLLSGSNIDINALSDLGKDLDTYSDSKLISAISQLITIEIFNMATSLQGLSSEAMTILNSLKTDVSNYVNEITSYEAEYQNIETLYFALTGFLDNSITLPALGAELDKLTSSAILFNAPELITDYIKQSFSSQDETMVNAVFDNIETLVSNSTTYANIFTQINTLKNTLDGITTLQDDIENADITEFGTHLDTLQGLSIFGSELTKQVNAQIFNEAIEYLEEMQAQYPNQPEIPENPYYVIEERIQNLNNKLTEINNSTTQIDYEDVYIYVDTQLSM